MECNIEQYCSNSHCSVEMIVGEVKKLQVHQINKGRAQCSEYHQLFPVLKNYPDKFEMYTRMKPTTFEYILSKVYNCLLKRWCNLHQQPIKPEEKLVITLRFLITGASYSDLSFSFLMGKSTVANVIEDVLNALWGNLASLHMAPPTTDVLMDIAQDFYLRWDIPHCVGALDVRHIRIKKPDHSGSLYYNYKNFFSITLQAVVDANYRFIIIEVGGYGHQHDATTLRLSKLYKAIKTKKIKLPEEDELYDSRVTMPYFFIADGAYPLNNNLMKPYSGKNLSEEQKIFNKRLSRARVVVECAFGRLCQKWRIFYTTIQQPPSKTEKIVQGACILHNVIIDIEKPKSLISRHLATESVFVEGDDREPFTEDGEMIRKKLEQFFLQNPL